MDHLGRTKIDESLGGVKKGPGLSKENSPVLLNHDRDCSRGIPAILNNDVDGSRLVGQKHLCWRVKHHLYAIEFSDGRRFILFAQDVWQRTGAKLSPDHEGDVAEKENSKARSADHADGPQVDGVRGDCKGNDAAEGTEDNHEFGSSKEVAPSLKDDSGDGNDQRCDVDGPFYDANLAGTAENQEADAAYEETDDDQCPDGHISLLVA